MNIQIKSASGGPDHRVTYLDGSWSCDCLGFYYRRRCRHIREAQEQAVLAPTKRVSWDRRWWWGIRDGESVFWQALFGIGGPVVIFDGESAALVTWEQAPQVIESVRMSGKLVEADSAFVEAAYFHYLIHRK